MGGGECGWEGGAGQRGIKGRKKWDNCNSIINKIYIYLKSTHWESQNSHRDVK